MSKFAPISIYLVISLLVSLISLDLSFPLYPIVQPIQKNCRPMNVVLILPMMPEVVLISNFILFPFYLLSLMWKSPFPFLRQYLSTRLISLDLGP